MEGFTLSVGDALVLCARDTQGRPRETRLFSVEEVAENRVELLERPDVRGGTESVLLFKGLLQF